MVKAGDKDAVKLFNDNSQIPMPPDQALSDNDIKTILAFIKTEGTPQVAAASSGSSNVTPVNSIGTDNITIAAQKTAVDEKSSPSFIESLTFTNYMVFFLIGILLLVIWVLSSSIKSLAE